MPDGASTVAAGVGFRAGGAHHELAQLGEHDAFDSDRDEHADPADPRVIPEYNAWLRGAEENWAIDDADSAVSTSADALTRLTVGGDATTNTKSVTHSRADTGMSHGSASTSAPPAAVAHQLVADHVVTALANADRKAQYDRRLAEATKALTRLGFAVSRAVYTVERVVHEDEAAAATGSRTSTAPTTTLGSSPRKTTAGSVAKTPRPPVAAGRSSTASGGVRPVSISEAMHSDPITSRVRVRVQLPEARVASDAAEHLAANASGGGGGQQHRTIDRIPGFATADHPSARGEQGTPAHKSCVLLVSLPPFQLCKLQNAFKVSPYSRTVHWSDEFDTTNVSSSVAAAVATAVAEAMSDGKAVPARRVAAIRNDPRLNADVAAARYTESHLLDVADFVLKSFNLAVVPHYGLGAPPGAPPSRPPPLLTAMPGTRERSDATKSQSRSAGTRLVATASTSRQSFHSAAKADATDGGRTSLPPASRSSDVPRLPPVISVASPPPNVGNHTPSLPPVLRGAKPVSGRPQPKTARR